MYSLPMEKRLYTISETAEYLKVSRGTVYKLIEEEKIQPVYLTDRNPRVKEEDLIALVNSKLDGKEVE